MAAAGFRIRRVKTEQSIGDRLKRSRIRRKITVAQVEEATKIRAKFILALESDSWEQIPSEVYGRGYLERYLTFLQMPSDVVMAQYDRERSLYARNCQDAQVELAPRQKLTIPRFLLTPRFFVGVGVVALLVGFTGVVIHQIARFNATPFLAIVSPVQAKVGGSETLVVSTNSITVEGKTSSGATVMANEQPATVHDDGSFSATVPLVGKGMHTILIKATNNKGTATETLSVSN